MGDISAKVKSQKRKNPQISLQLNTKQIQFGYEQNEEDVKQIMLISHKAQFQKIILPRIEESY